MECGEMGMVLLLLVRCACSVLRNLCLNGCKWAGKKGENVEVEYGSVLGDNLDGGGWWERWTGTVFGVWGNGRGLGEDQQSLQRQHGRPNLTAC